MKLKLALVVVCLCALLAAGCGGGGKRVEVKWESETTQVKLADESSKDGGSTLRTTVYVSVGGDTTIRDAVVRLGDEELQTALGLSIGTVTPISTEFQGDSRIWRLGDLEPGKRYGLSISLFFSSTHAEAAPERFELSVEVSSPDLAEPVRSNGLAVSLKR
jgi:hypothetical protein